MGQVKCDSRTGQKEAIVCSRSVSRKTEEQRQRGYVLGFLLIGYTMYFLQERLKVIQDHVLGPFNRASPGQIQGCRVGIT